MAVSRCPLCGSPCILKIVATEDENWTKVDVCEMCLTMYPRGRDVVVAASKEKTKSRARKTKKTGARAKKKPRKR